MAVWFLTQNSESPLFMHYKLLLKNCLDLLSRFSWDDNLGYFYDKKKKKSETEAFSMPLETVYLNVLNFFIRDIATLQYVLNNIPFTTPIYLLQYVVFNATAAEGLPQQRSSFKLLPYTWIQLPHIFFKVSHRMLKLTIFLYKYLIMVW